MQMSASQIGISLAIARFSYRDVPVGNVPSAGSAGRETLGLVVCEEDSCVPLPSPPDDPTPGTLVPGPGNPPVHFPKGKKGGKKRNHDRRGSRR